MSTPFGPPRARRTGRVPPAEPRRSRTPPPLALWCDVRTADRPYRGSRSQTRRAAQRSPETRTVAMDAELEPFVPMFPTGNLSDPVTARRELAQLAAAAPAIDTAALEIEDHVVSADPDVAVRTYRPHDAHGGAIVWMHGGGFVMGDLDTEHPWAARIAGGLTGDGRLGRVPPGTRASLPGCAARRPCGSRVDSRARRRPRRRSNADRSRRPRRRGGARRRRGVART